MIQNSFEYNQGRLYAQSLLADGFDAKRLRDAAQVASNGNVGDFDNGFNDVVNKKLEAKL